MIMAEKYLTIQQAEIENYGITINECSACRGRMHAHPKKRTICKWHPKNSMRATFDLFHEIGHVVTHRSDMRRCESEYEATVFAIDLCRLNGLEVPEQIRKVYQDYIYLELDRGVRRHGKSMPSREDLRLKGW